jgi:nucleoside-diphosphate-sugar epimerase
LTGKILVTGYGGFIGCHLCRRLVGEGYSVLGSDLRDAGLPSVEHRKVDVSDWNSFRGLPDRLDCVIHLAGISSIPRAQEDFIRTYDVNVLGTYNALKYASHAGASFIFASSSKVYGTPRYVPVDEAHPLAPENTYGRSKAASEELVGAFQAESSGSHTIFRQFNVFGPGQGREFFIPTVLSQLKKSAEVSLGDVSLMRDFLYIDDLIDAYMLVVRGRPIGLNVYNVGGGECVTLRQIVEEAAKICGRKLKLRVDSSRVRPDAKEIYSDNMRLSGLGWKPKTKVGEGLAKMLR